MLLLLSYVEIKFENIITTKTVTNTSIITNHNKRAHTLQWFFSSDPCQEVLKWKHPFTCIVGESLGSGKTSFVSKLIKQTDVMFPKFLN